MINSNYVLTAGLTEEQKSSITDALDSPFFGMISAHSARQIIEGDYFALIINRDMLEESDAEELELFFSEIDGGYTTKIFFAKEEDSLTQSADALIYPSLEDFLPEAYQLLKKAYSRAKRQESLTNSLCVSLYILDQIRAYPGISTAALAEKLSRSEAAVKRYIEELIMAGKKIEYDTSAHGWKLCN